MLFGLGFHGLRRHFRTSPRATPAAHPVVHRQGPKSLARASRIHPSSTGTPRIDPIEELAPEVAGIAGLLRVGQSLSVDRVEQSRRVDLFPAVRVFPLPGLPARLSANRRDNCGVESQGRNLWGEAVHLPAGTHPLRNYGMVRDDRQDTRDCHACPVNGLRRIRSSRGELRPLHDPEEAGSQAGPSAA